MALIVKNVDWEQTKHRLCRLREKVFVYEWRIPRECEFDQHDNEAIHVLISDDDGQDIATGRLTPAGEIGRIAVEASFRKPEVYQALFSALLSAAEQIGLTQVFVQCELEGVEYFQQQGFHPVDSVYMDAGIPRQKMFSDIHNFSIRKVELTH